MTYNVFGGTLSLTQSINHDSCSAWGALTNFPGKLRLSFSPPQGVQVHPLHPLATHMNLKPAVNDNSRLQVRIYVLTTVTSSIGALW